MKQIKTFCDERLEGLCTYCQGPAETTDHVPSKVLLDLPYPENLPVVPACYNCNQSFSLDEEYFACLIECALCGSTHIADIQRNKVREIFLKRPILRDRIEKARKIINGNVYFMPEQDRIRNVILKLARGHAKYENGEPQIGVPSSINITPITLMSESQHSTFFSHKSILWPEIGSRNMQRQIKSFNGISDSWMDVQENNYTYSFALIPNVSVRFLIRNYLACEVEWG